MSILQDMHKDPVKELAPEIAAEEASPTETGPTVRKQQEAERIAQYDAEQSAQEEAPRSETEPSTATPEEAAASEDVEPEEKFVPVKAVAEARRIARQWEERAREYERVLAEQEGYRRALEAQQQQQGQQYQEAPDPETDPIGALRYEREQRQQLQQQLEREAAYREQHLAVERFKQHAGNDLRTYVTQKPEAAEAYKFLFGGRVKELQAMNGMSEAQAIAQVQHEEVGFFYDAYQRGVHPGDKLMQVAQARNWKPGPAVAAPSIEQKMEAAKTRATAAVGVAKGGKPPASGIKAEDLLHLQGKAFDTAWDKLVAQERRPIINR